MYLAIAYNKGKGGMKYEDANKEFFKVEPGNIVYHTSNEKCIVHIRKDPLMRVRRI